METTESINGAVNYDLERILGFKAHGLTLSEAGPGVVALVDVLQHFIDLFPCDEVLKLWPPAVLEAAQKVYETAKKTIPKPQSKRSVASDLTLPEPSRGKRAADEETDSDDKPAAAAKAQPRKKHKTTRKITSVPGWVDIPEPGSNTGRPYDRLSRQLSILCYDSSDTTQSKQLRCVGSPQGCAFSWAFPRNRTRVLKHASQCMHIDVDFRQQASALLSSQAPSAVAEQLQPTSTTSLAALSSSSSELVARSPLFELASSSGKQQLKAVVDFDVVQFICAAGLPPFCVDRLEFKTMIQHLNNRYVPVSSSTLANNQIPAEAARVLKKSISILWTLRNLTLSFDGGDTRRPRSVYTFHVATPERRVFLIRGKDVSTESHTGEYIASIARQILSEVGHDRFAAVVTDGAANMVRTRRILVEETPTILNLSDPCHKMSLLIKDICKLEEFLETIRVICRVLSFFGKSVYACALLEERRKLLKILRGLEAMVDTRIFVEEAIVIPEHNQRFMGSSPASIMFEMQLTVLVAVLDLILRGITCLESSFSTPADVLLIFSSTLARLDKHLRSGTHGISRPKTIEGIRTALSKRFSELINKSPDDLYVGGFYLDPYYRNSQLLRDINPFTIKITLNASEEFSSHSPTAAMVCRLGRFFIIMLRREWDSYPDGIVRAMYSTATEAKEALRQQVLLYATATYPFSEKIGKNMLAYQWWKPLQENPSSKLLAYFALKLFSITPNSMADERTVSAFGWLNSALRSRQDVATIVRQTQIRQFYAWDKEKHEAKRTRIRYRDIKYHRRSEKAKLTSSNSSSSEHNTEPSDNSFQAEYSETGDTWLDESDDDVPGVDFRPLEVNNLIDLDAPEVEDCLADKAPAELKNKYTAFEDSRKVATEVTDRGMTEDDWVF
ncbi:hypothetical protein FRC07_008235 [Ceratobasidium sp. 392]|nr:hypothetical protein FRC07_008235 [Ceratobasidium sp. 392]